MAMTFTTHPNTYGTSLTARVALAVTAIPQNIADRLALQKTQRSLRKLTNYQLEDIGLTPGDVDRMSR